MCAHCGHTTWLFAAAGAACGGATGGMGAATGTGAGGCATAAAMGTGAGMGARDGTATGDCATATVPASPATWAAAVAWLEAWPARTPCGGVLGENGFGAASRGNSAPHPRQNL
jgi:hypothetical protein